ncbi:MAG: LD-carboxypeptidase [Clostridia bacterium]|nr:LD-carboxypeptidase [Clostridia bacterium]
MEIRKPKILKPGANIGVIAPASPCEHEITEKYCRMLSGCGFGVTKGESCFSHYGYLAGEDKIRACDINRMFEDSSIDAVFCLRGGYGCTRIADLINIKKISENPKIFLGFSDITVLHTIFNNICGFITFHGPSVSNCEWGQNDFRFKNCMKILTGGKCILNGEYCYNSASCSGMVCGGNLSLVESLIGTKYEPDITGKILLLEDVGECNYAIDRRLTHLRQAGYFDKCTAVVLGQFTERNEHENNNNIPLRKIVEDVIVPCGKPVIWNTMFGHIPYNPTIPLGAYGKIRGSTLTIPGAVCNQI